MAAAVRARRGGKGRAASGEEAAQGGDAPMRAARPSSLALRPIEPALSGGGAGAGAGASAGAGAGGRGPDAVEGGGGEQRLVALSGGG